MAQKTLPFTSTFTTAIPFDQPVTYLGEHTVTGALTFTKVTTGAEVTFATIVRLVADGTHLPDFSAFKKFGAGDYVNTNGTVNQCWFMFDGTEYCVAFTQPSTIAGAVDVTPPTVVSMAVYDGTNIDVVFSETVVPTTAGWTPKIGGVSKTAASWSGSGTTWRLTISGGTIASGNTVTMSYDSTTGNTLDTASNELASFTNSAVTNSLGLTQLSTPSGPTLTPSGTSLQVDWGNVANESSFSVQLATNNTFSSGLVTVSKSADVLTHTFTGLTPGPPYYVRVKAVGDGITYSDSAYTATQSSTVPGGGGLLDLAGTSWYAKYDPDTGVTVDGSNNISLVDNLTIGFADTATDLAQISTPNQPLLVAAAQNSHSVIRVSPGKNIVVGGYNGVSGITKPVELYFAFKTPSSLSGFKYALFNQGDGPCRMGWDMSQASGAGRFFIYAGSVLYGTTTAPTANTWYIVRIVLAGGGADKLYLNDVLEVSGDAGSAADHYGGPKLGFDASDGGTADFGRLFVWHGAAISDAQATAYFNEQKTYYGL